MIIVLSNIFIYDLLHMGHRSCDGEHNMIIVNEHIENRSCVGEHFSEYYVIVCIKKQFVEVYF